MARASFGLGPVRVRPGTARGIELPITRLVTGAEITLPVRVVHGRQDGPTLWLTAATHGDEVVGVEVIRRVLARLDPKGFRGTLVAVPIVNVLGFTAGDRYLPDRRDLNRSFPGSPRGSLASRIAHLLMTEVVGRGDVGIDLHTGAFGRANHPQVRADLDDPRTRMLAEAFGAPIMINAKLRDGSLRAAARERGVAVLLYEGGEAWRFDDWAIEAGVTGVRRVLAALDMADGPAPDQTAPLLVSRSSGWVRARRTGILHLDAVLGERVERGDRLGSLSDSFGKTLRLVHADRSGVVIGRTSVPVVNRGDALLHIAEVDERQPGEPIPPAEPEPPPEPEPTPEAPQPAPPFEPSVDLEPDLS